MLISSNGKLVVLLRLLFFEKGEFVDEEEKKQPEYLGSAGHLIKRIII